MTAIPDTAAPERTAPEGTQLDDAVRTLLESTTSTRLRPGYEGCTISTSLGFKHINYLAEAAVLEHFRSAGLPAGLLYDEYGLGLDVVELDTRLPAHLHVDDVPTLTVQPMHGPRDTRLRFKVVSTVERGGSTVSNATSKVSVALRADPLVRVESPLPSGLERFVVDRLGTAEPQELQAQPVPRGELAHGRGASTDPVLAELTEGRNAFGWRWRMPYFYCHFGNRVPMSGFLRQMEEVVDLFLAERGLPIQHVYDEWRWIPVVTKSHIELLDEVRMEEDLYTIYTVEDVFKELLYTSRMDCYVVRDGKLVCTATGRITHGYMTQRPTGAWEMVSFDETTMRALTGADR